MFILISSKQVDKFLRQGSLISNEEPVKVFIKNMATLRTQQEVKLLIESMGFRIAAINIGEIEIKESLSEQNFSEQRS